MTHLIITEPVDELTGSVNWPLMASLSNQSPPSTEELFIQISEVNYFLESDSSSGYLQIKIDKESLNLLDFCFKQLSYDIHSTSDVFHNTVLLTIFNVQNCVQILRMTP